MKAKTTRFVVKLLTVGMVLVSFLVVDAFLSGALSLWGLLALAPACSLVTYTLVGLCVPAKKRARRSVAARGGYPPHTPQRTVRRPAPAQLQVHRRQSQPAQAPGVRPAA